MTRDEQGGLSPHIRVIEDAMQAFEDYSCFIDTLTPETTQEEAQPGHLMFERAAHMLKKALELRGLRVRAFASVAAAAAGTSLPPKRLTPPDTAQ